MLDPRLLERVRQGDRAAADAVAAAASRAVLGGRLDDAEGLLRAALAAQPRSAVLLARSAGIRQLRGDAAGALALARAAVREDPGESMAATLAIDGLVEQGLAGEALRIGDAALARGPVASVLRAQSQALLMAGRAPDALRHALDALAVAPGDPTAISSACIAGLYDDTLDGAALARLHAAHASRMSPAANCGAPAPRPPRAGRRLRIGILSPDLRDHPMGRFAQPLLAHLDRARFELFVYARVAAPDAVTARLQALPDLAWRDTAALDDAAVHAWIQRDAIDVLLDLAGHTAGGRPRLIAARAAPVQLGWLGYPHPSGLPNVDGFIADATICPPGSELPGLEPVLRIDGSALCLPPDPQAPPVATPPATRGVTFTFGSFNHLAKLSDATVALWCRVLEAVPDARLALCALPLRDPALRATTQSRFSAHGLDPRRLLLLPPRRPLAAFLAQYDAVDVALDPLPFHGGTTSAQALWQGVPVLSLAGDAPQRRLGASLLRAAGLADVLLARDGADYVAMARALSADPSRLAILRASLRERLAAATDGRDFARRFGAAIEAFMAGRPDAHA
jgi:predicted O-linked N-acetylglucosamine transferase (SPINDLY family)